MDIKIGTKLRNGGYPQEERTDQSRGTVFNAVWLSSDIDTTTPEDQYKEVDERFDKEFTCVVTYEKWPDEEEQRLREPQYKFKDFPNTNPKIIKNFLHSELEKVRQETIEACKSKIIDYFAGSGELWFPYIGVGAETREEEIESAKDSLEDLLEALSINKK